MAEQKPQAMTPEQALVNVSIICSRYDKYDLQTADAIKASFDLLSRSLQELAFLKNTPTVPADPEQKDAAPAEAT